MYPAITNEQIMSLVPRCQSGETAALEQLYDLYADRLYRYLLARVGDQDTAADLTTELFIRVIPRISSFRLNKTRPAASFSAWLYRIAGNLVTDFYRTRGRLAQVNLDGLQTRANPRSDPQHAVEHDETTSQLASAVNRLSKDQQLVVVAKFAEGMSNAEIAAWLDKTEGAVKSLQHRALRSLGRLLDSNEA